MVFSDTPGKVSGPRNLPNKIEGTKKEMSQAEKPEILCRRC